LPYEFGLLWDDFDTARLRTLARHPTVSQGRMGRDQDPGLQLVQAPPSRSLHDLGSLVLGDDALHRQQHLVFGRSGNLSVDKVNLAAVPLKLLDDYYLVGVSARQAIWAMHEHGIDQTISRIITQPIEPRTRQQVA
jgi:hypothetical protein